VANNPFWFKRNNHNIASSKVADSLGDTFQSRYISQQIPLDISQYSASPIHRPMPSMNKSYGTGLSQETKLEELKRLVCKYAQFHNNSPDEIVRWAIYWSSNGDDTFLDAKLEQLSRLDSYIT
jgi:hypothetical protein